MHVISDLVQESAPKMYAGLLRLYLKNKVIYILEILDSYRLSLG